MTAPKVAVAPFGEPGLLQAIESGGGVLVEALEADAIVWTDPRDPQGLKDLLVTSPARWVQLPFAGVESFIEAGVVDPALTWTCAKGIYGPACAEHALALMLAASRRLHVHARNKEWIEPGLGSPERRLSGLTALVVGTGGIGSSLVEMIRPLGMRVLAVNRSGAALDGAERTAAIDALPKFLDEADFVVICAALTSETRGMFDSEMLGRMKPDAWLVNVARGGLVDTDALVDALERSAIGGAALDVTDPEPLPSGHRLWELDNAIVTPHIANTWDMALPELRALVRRNVEHFARQEELEAPLDPALGY